MTIRNVEVCDACLRPRNPKENDWFEEGDTRLCGRCKRAVVAFERKAMSAELNFDAHLVQEAA